MNATLAMDAIRSIVGVVDKVIYNLISVIYKIILQMANINLFSQQNIEDVSNRIYIFLGVFMLFKVTFSLISYLVNPDGINDKNNGIGNIAKNVIVTLFLIIIVPFAFDLLYDAQSAILEDHLIPRIIFGTEGDGSNVGTQNIIMDENACKYDETGTYANKSEKDRKITTDNITDDGQFLALLTLRPFYQIYSDQKGEIIDNNNNLTTHGNQYCKAIDTNELLSGDLINAESGVMNTGKYVIDYSFFLSTATGILVFLLLLNFAFDIATRTVKLGFLEIIAPIPIMSYIDPKSSKDGTFKKWLNEVVKTWASLFIRLAIVYFSIYAIKILADRWEEIDAENSMWVMLFLIIGILMFAKQAIPLIENIFGIKFDKSVQLNPFKKVSDQALGGKVIAGLGMGAAAVGFAGAGSAAANFANARMSNKDWKTTFKDAGRGLGTGALFGAAQGYKNGTSGKYKLGIKDAVTSSSKNRNYSDFLAEQGIKGPFKVTREKIRNDITDVTGTTGTAGDSNIVSNRKKELENAQRIYEQQVAQYDEAIGNITGNNPNKSKAYIDAIKKVPIKNADGKFVQKRETSDYGSFMAQQFEFDLENYKQRSEVECRQSIPEWNNLSDDVKKKYIEDNLNNRISYEYGSRQDGLTINEYNSINAADLARTDVQEKVIATKKEITKIDKNQSKDK